MMKQTLLRMNLVRKSSMRLTPSISSSISRNFSLAFEPVEERENPLDENAESALNKSCYKTINWKISENAKVIDAIQRMVAHRYYYYLYYESSPLLYYNFNL